MCSYIRAFLICMNVLFLYIHDRFFSRMHVGFVSYICAFFFSFAEAFFFLCFCTIVVFSYAWAFYSRMYVWCLCYEHCVSYVGWIVLVRRLVFFRKHVRFVFSNA